MGLHYHLSCCLLLSHKPPVPSPFSGAAPRAALTGLFLLILDVVLQIYGYRLSNLYIYAHVKFE